MFRDIFERVDFENQVILDETPMDPRAGLGDGVVSLTAIAIEFGAFLRNQGMDFFPSLSRRTS